MFSLKELRRFEDERVEAEAEARRAQAEAERRAKAEAEQRARDEEARRLREVEEGRQRAESEREARQREDRLRVEEAERRARVEGELKLRAQQMQGRRVGRSVVAAGAGAALLLAVGGGLAAWASREHQAETKALEQQIARLGEEARAAQLAFDAKIRDLEDKARRDLGEAKTAEDEARILRDLQRQKQALEAARPRPPRRTAPPVRPAPGPPKTQFVVPHKRRIVDDPLGELPAVEGGGF